MCFMAVKKGAENVAEISPAVEKAPQSDGKPSNHFETVNFQIAVKDVGICQVVFPYREGLAAQLNNTLEFGVPFDLNEIGILEDIEVTLYNNSLNVKYLMKEFPA